jgi:glyoxylase-like metal-dependent hydrolase (beta-lactamase superfamily II)
MDSLTILIEGNVKILAGKHLWAAPSSVLIRKSGKNLLVDPGSNPGLLVEALRKEGLQPGDIDIVFLTHYHLDHLLNIRLFPHQDIFDGTTLYRLDEEIPCVAGIPMEDVEVAPTPGHTPEHASLLVNTAAGRYAVAGDVFWWEDGREPSTDRDSLMALPDPYAQDWAALKESRLKLLQLADFIIPGHGHIFQETKRR